MIDLKCKCTNCTHNHFCNCEADNIMVTKGTRCETFTPSFSKTTEYADEILEPLVRKSVDVDCNAPCLFNKQGTCIANGITISIGDNKAKCESFLKE